MPTKPSSPVLVLLGASCWLALFLVVAKALSGAIPWWPQVGARGLTLLASSWRDALFALSAGAVGAIAVLLCARWPRSARLVRGLFLFLFTACAFYAVGAIGLFRYFNRPLTYNLFGLIGNAAAIRSSIAERLTWPLALALLLVPALFYALARRPWRSRLALGGALAFGVLWIAVGWSLQRRGWEAEKLEFLALSPHVELLRSSVLRLTGGARPSFPKDFPPEYLDEFRTYGARAGASAAHFPLPPGVERPKNVIVIILESVGAKYLGLYGHPTDYTPTLSAEARHALVFNQIYAHASFTFASFRPLLFSVYPGLPWHYALLEDGQPIPEPLSAEMKTRGARTAYITPGDLYWRDQFWLLSRHGQFDLLADASNLGCPVLSSWGGEDRCALDRLRDFIEQEPARPFFAVCWTDQTHDPYLLSEGTAPLQLPPADARGPFASDLARYLAILQQTDAQLARVFATLRARGIADDTLVVVTGDHGEAFADPHQQRGHAWSVYEEEVHVPLMVWNPRLFPEGGRSEAVGGHVDINPTMADLLGIKPPDGWQGFSLFDPARPPRAYFMAIAGGSVFGVREGDWKYIYDVTSGRESLFDLATDPREQRDLSAREAERARRLRQRVAAWVTFEDAFLWGRTN